MHQCIPDKVYKQYNTERADEEVDIFGASYFDFLPQYVNNTESIYKQYKRDKYGNSYVETNDTHEFFQYTDYIIFSKNKDVNATQMLNINWRQVFPKVDMFDFTYNSLHLMKYTPEFVNNIFVSIKYYDTNITDELVYFENLPENINTINLRADMEHVPDILQHMSHHVSHVNIGGGDIFWALNNRKFHINIDNISPHIKSIDFITEAEIIIDNIPTSLESVVSRWFENSTILK